MEPSEFHILVNLRDALRNIKVTSGYHFDVEDVAVKLDPNADVESLIAPGGPRPFVVIEVRPDVWAYSPSKRVNLTLPMAIHWVSDASPTDDESRMLTFFRGCADVERAIAADVSRGGLAIDTTVIERAYSTAIDGAQVWAINKVQILTRRIYGQPDS
jgi:hypothetical protein